LYFSGKREMMKKDARNMLAKLTTGINFNNILRATFSPSSLCQKIQNQTAGKKTKRLVRKKAGRKMSVKLTAIHFTNIF